MVEHGKIIGDGVSIGAVIGSLVGALPAIAAFFTIVWTLIRIYETKTMQRLLLKTRKKKEE